MDVTQVLTHLQAQFSGQLVLYVDDVATLLGKSEKAISNLMARKRLPFRIKMVGGRRCVDIFQVAQWMCSDAEVSQDVAGSAANASLATAPQKKRENQGRGRGLSAHRDGAEQKTAGLMASQILQMRHDYCAPLERFVSRLRNSDELAFMYEVLSKLFYSADLLASSYVVTVRRFAPNGYKVRGEESAKYFDSEEHACNFLVSKLEGGKQAKNKKHLVHFVLSYFDKTLFHAVVTARTWTILSNVIHLELPGL